MDCVKIGKLIAKLRKEKKLTQKNVADALGVQNKTVSKWECGLGCPDL
jgi:transcriptional regulator with XRE-family HTH domain